jgi:MFS family permease
VILPSAWLYLQHLGAHHRLWLSLSISSFSLASFIFSPIYGQFADRFSTKQILLLSNCFEMAGNLLYLLSNDVYSNIEARFIAGMGAAAGSVIFAWIGRTAGSMHELNEDMGLVMTCRGIGLIVGPAFNFLLIKIDVHIGSFHLTNLNSPGLLMLIIWVLAQGVVYFLFVDPPPLDKPAVKGLKGSEAGEPVEEKAKLSDFLGLGVVALLLVQFINMFNQTAYETFVTPFTQEVFDFSQLANSIIYMISAAVAISVYKILTRLQYVPCRNGRQKENVGTHGPHTCRLLTSSPAHLPKLHFRLPLSSPHRRRYNLKDRSQIAFGITLQLIAFLLFWLTPSTSRSDLWKFSFASVLFIGALPFIYVAPALQAKLTTRRCQVRAHDVMEMNALGTTKSPTF